MNFVLLFSLLLTGVERTDRTSLVVVVGAPGTAEYGEEFQSWAHSWRSAAEQGDSQFTLVGSPTETDRSDRELLSEIIAAEAKRQTGEFWLVLIGHGTFDGREAKFNLRGPDISAGELAEQLAPMQRPTVIINCASSSSPFINRLSGERRVIVTATKSGSERNYARWGRFMAESIADKNADLDKDGQTSLLEAYLIASRKTEDFYKQQGRLATEHALLDDNGDGLGVPATTFQGVRTTLTTEDDRLPDGRRAHQLHLIRSEQEQQIPAEVRQRRDELELQVLELRGRKKTLTEEEYDRQLEELLLKLARLFESLEAKQKNQLPHPVAPVRKFPIKGQ